MNSDEFFEDASGSLRTVGIEAGESGNPSLAPETLSFASRKKKRPVEHAAPWGYAVEKSTIDSNEHARQALLTFRLATVAVSLAIVLLVVVIERLS